MKVAASSIGCSVASRAIARNIPISLSVVRPYPLLTSAVVVPARSISARRGRAASTRLADAGRTRCLDRLQDAASLGGYLRVGRTGQPAAQLVAPIAREHCVRVGVDEPGQNRAACRVEDQRAWGLLDKPVADLRRADKQQASLTRRQRPVVDRGHLRHVGADARRRTGTGQQRLRVAKDEVGDHLVEHN